MLLLFIPAHWHAADGHIVEPIAAQPTDEHGKQ
jgi:hypothetical protein